jgi:adenosylhomocysteine nucleosidase
MRILVTFAVNAEFAPWRKLRRFDKLASGSMEGYFARVEDAELTILFTGIAGKKAWLEATKVLWDAHVDICISSGLAGALRLEHQLGDILAAESVHIAEQSRDVFSDPQLMEGAVACGAKRVRAFHSSNHVVIRADEKQELGGGADAVEMESGEILAEAAVFGARGIAVRCISDTADEDLPLDFNRATTQAGDVSLARILGQVAQHPGSVPSLIRFGQQSRSAAENLAAFLDRYVVNLVAANIASAARGATSA